MESILRKFAPAIAAFADEHKMQVARESYHPEMFGNVIVELTSKEFDLCVIRDRLQMWMEIRPSYHGDWYFLETVLAFIGVQVEPLDFDQSARALAENYSAVVRVMMSNLELTGFTSFDKQVKQKRMEELLRVNRSEPMR